MAGHESTQAKSRTGDQSRTNSRRFIGSAFGFAALLIGGGLLYRTLSRYDASEIGQSVASADSERLANALALAAASYVSLTLFDWLGLRYAGRPLAWRRAAWTSFTSLSIGHNIGFAVLSSGAVRYRFYTRWGLSPFEVGKVIVFCGVTVALGLATLGGSILLIRPEVGDDTLGINSLAAFVVGLACLAVPAAYILAAFARVGRLKFRRWELDVPPIRLAVQQVAIGLINFALVAGCLHQSLNAISEVSYSEVATTYVLANTAAVASHVPGGLGVIEQSVLYLLPDGATIAGLLIFRVAYFIVPLPLGIISFVLSEFLISRRDYTA